MCSSPSGHAASMRSSARRSVAASTWLRAEMPDTMWSQRQTPRSSIAASETFGCQPGPTYGNRFRQDCLASQQPSTKPRSGSTPSTGSTPSAGHRMGRGKGALASPLRLQRTTSTPTYSASFAHVCACKKKGGSLGLRAYSMTPGATRLSKLVGCALSRSVYARRLLSPIHDAVLGFEHCMVAKARRILDAPPRYLAQVKTDCLLTQRLPKRFTERLRALEALRHPDGAPVYRVEETKPLLGAAHGGGAPQTTEVEQGGRPRGPLPGGQLIPAAHGPAGHRKDVPGPDHCGEAARAGRGGAPGVQDALLRAEPGPDGRPLGAQVRAQGQRAKAGLAGGGGDHAAGHGALGGPGLRGAERRREVPAAGRLPAVAGRAGLLGRAAHQRAFHSQLIRDLAGGHRHELTENMRSDPGIFNFVKWLRVGEEACPTLEQAKARLKELFPSKPGWPDTSLVISHSKRMAVNAAANRALAPEASKLLELEVIHMGCYESVPTQNSPQSMRVWPGLRLIGAGGKIPKGVFVAVAEVEPDGVRLDNGMRLKNQELLRATRPSHAVTYASCQGLTLHNRVRLDLESCHLTLRHLYVGALRATSSELLRTGSTAPPGAPA